MCDTPNYYDKGREDCRSYYNSKGFSGLSRTIKPEDAMRLFWTPTEEAMMMITRPMDKDRVKWMKGWRAEVNTIIAERENANAKENENA